MSGIACESFADPTTIPIFDDVVYCKEALLLFNQGEDELDELIATEARESGIVDPYKYLNPELYDQSTALSTLTVSSDKRSSTSIHSQESQSTGITSHPSRTSKDHGYGDTFSFARIVPTPQSRNSISTDNYDATLERFRPSMRHTHSSSTASTVASALSTASQPKSVGWRGHGHRLRAMFRRESSSSTSRPRPKSRAHTALPTTGWGHPLSKEATRTQVKGASDNDEDCITNYCGKPLPNLPSEASITKEELDNIDSTLRRSTAVAVEDGLDHSHDGTLDNQCLISGAPQPSSNPALHINTNIQDLLSGYEDSLNKALANEAFCVLRDQQKEQFQRIAAFESKQRRALASYFAWSRKRLQSQLVHKKAVAAEQHKLELERLENRQLEEEENMIKSHALEIQNAATKTKYMEAYCNGINKANPDIQHTVTEDDRQKLQRQHAHQTNLPRQHESAINVLRAKQERAEKMKKSKQVAELKQIDIDFEKNMQALELQFLKESGRLDTLIEARRRRVVARWDLKFDVWKQDFEAQHGTPLEGRPPHEDWPAVNNLTRDNVEGALAPFFHLEVPSLSVSA